MGKFGIKQIVGHIANNPLLEPNRYEVIINGPVAIDAAKAKAISFSCSEASIPGHNIGTFEHSIAGPKRKIPNEELFDDLSLTFYNGHHMWEIGFIDDWMRLIAGESNFRMSYYNDIVADINILIYDLRENKVADVRLTEAYPIGMADVPLSYDADGPSKLSVNFTYHTYTIERF